MIGVQLHSNVQAEQLFKKLCPEGEFLEPPDTDNETM